MTIGLLDVVNSLMEACSKQVTKAKKKLKPSHDGLSRQTGMFPCSPMHSFQSKRRAKKGGRSGLGDDGSDVEEEKQGLWRKTILMGEKCQPLDFSGVIYYDSDGNRLAEVPTPRSPLRSPLNSLPRSPLNSLARSPLNSLGGHR